MKNVLQIFILSFGLFYHHVGAQSVTKTDTLNGTPYRMSMDARLSEEIDKVDESCDRKAITKTKTLVKSPGKTYTPSRALTTAEICRQNPKISGFKIQVAVAKSNNEANVIKAKFRNMYPYIKVITDASLRPNYRILAGSYFNKDSANPDYRKIKGSFGDARIVTYNIFCVDAK